MEAGEPASESGTTARSNLGNALASRFETANHRDDIDEAVVVLRDAQPSAGSAGRPSVFINPAKALSIRHEHFGEPGDLDDAIVAAQSALDSATPGSVRRARYQSMLGWMRQLGATQAQPGDVDHRQRPFLMVGQQQVAGRGFGQVGIPVAGEMRPPGTRQRRQHRVVGGLRAGENSLDRGH